MTIESEFANYKNSIISKIRNLELEKQALSHSLGEAAFTDLQNQVESFLLKYKQFSAEFSKCKDLYKKSTLIFDQKKEIDLQLIEFFRQMNCSKEDLSLATIERLFNEIGYVEAAELIGRANVSENELENIRMFYFNLLKKYVHCQFTWNMSETEFSVSFSESFNPRSLQSVFESVLSNFEFESVFDEFCDDLATFIATYPLFSIAASNDRELKLTSTSGTVSIVDLCEFLKRIGFSSFDFLYKYSKVTHSLERQTQSEKGALFLHHCKEIFSCPSKCLKIFRTPSFNSAIPLDFLKGNEFTFVSLLEESEFLVRDTFWEYATLLQEFLSYDQSLSLFKTSTLIAFTNIPIDFESACYLFNETQCLVQIVCHTLENIPQQNNEMLQYLIHLTEKHLESLKGFLPQINNDNFYDSFTSVINCYELMAVWIKGPSAALIAADLLSVLYESFIVNLFAKEEVIVLTKRKLYIKFCREFVNFAERFPIVTKLLHSDNTAKVLNEISILLENNINEVAGMIKSNFFTALSLSQVKQIAKMIFTQAEYLKL